MIKEHAAIAVIPRIHGAADFESEDEVGDLHIVDEGDVAGTPHLRLVFAFSPVDSENLVAVDFPVRPALLVGDGPVVPPFLEVIEDLAMNSDIFLLLIPGRAK